MTARVRRRFPTRPVWALAALLILIALRLVSDREPTAPSLPPTGKLHRVQRVVDGDTLLLEGGERVRLIGVDTPETKHPDLPPEPFGKEASEFTRRLVEGRDVRLEYDRERLDDYGRTLAYVYIDGRMLNEELIRGGYSPAKTYFPYRSDMKRRFRQAEQAAREAGRVIWSRGSP